MASEAQSHDVVILGSDRCDWNFVPRAVRRSIALFGIGLLLGGCVHSVPVASGARSLDSLLGFSKPERCEITEAHERFLRALWQGDTTDRGIRPGKIAAPPALRRAFGPVRVKKDESYWLVMVDVSGELFDLPLVRITQALPDGGDPGDVIYTFAAPMKRAQIKLRAAGIPVKANETVQLETDSAYDHLVYLVPDQDRPELTSFGCSLQ